MSITYLEEVFRLFLIILRSSIDHAVGAQQCLALTKDMVFNPIRLAL
ncbi:hypothetical protein [Nostoc favosum]|uniref:Transposase n=1 Tax=Nostoc favosum CHAB5714 TaxID=2780399 RepID=A0ABS8IL80_9NOSO|nr:hypothetical protein [Nostoc favosum]MCC5604624.1 hypothetical protein [Nostoc favosum CHAB5714]